MSARSPFAPGIPKTQEQRQSLAKLLADGEPVTKALAAAGWSPGQAARGWAAVPDDVKAMLPDKCKDLMERGKMPLKDFELLIKGRLAQNLIDGKDGGVMSAKIMGSHKDLGMWQQESQAGVIVINAPVKIQGKESATLEQSFADSLDSLDSPSEIINNR